MHAVCQPRKIDLPFVFLSSCVQRLRFERRERIDCASPWSSGRRNPLARSDVHDSHVEAHNGRARLRAARMERDAVPVHPVRALLAVLARDRLTRGAHRRSAVVRIAPMRLDSQLCLGERRSIAPTGAELLPTAVDPLRRRRARRGFRRDQRLLDGTCHGLDAIEDLANANRAHDNTDAVLPDDRSKLSRV